MKVIVDNYSVLAIEACILKELSNIFSPSTVMEFNDELVGRIAAETEVSLAIRHGASEKLKILHTGLQVLSRLSRRSAKSMNLVTGLTVKLTVTYSKCCRTCNDNL